MAFASWCDEIFGSFPFHPALFFAWCQLSVDFIIRSEFDLRVIAQNERKHFTHDIVFGWNRKLRLPASIELDKVREDLPLVNE